MSFLRKKSLLAAAVVFSGLCAGSAASATSYSYTQIFVPGSIDTEPLGISGNGAIVGLYYAPTSDPSVINVYGFLDVGGNYSQIAPNMGEAWGINNSGIVVGNYQDGSAFLYNNNTMAYTTLNVPASMLPNSSQIITQAYAINNNDLVVGQFEFTNSSSKLQFEGFTYKNGLYTLFTLPNLPSGDIFTPFGVNDNGHIVGYISSIVNSTITMTGFLYTLGASSYTALPYPTEGINNPGDIVGLYNPTSVGQEGFLLQNGTYTTIEPTLPNNCDCGTYAADINDSGDIVGAYTPAFSTDVGFIGFLASPVPEPSTWAMMLIGFAGLGFGGYRRAKKSRATVVAWFSLPLEDWGATSGVAFPFALASRENNVAVCNVSFTS